MFSTMNASDRWNCMKAAKLPRSIVARLSFETTLNHWVNLFKQFEAQALLVLLTQNSF